MLLLLPYRHHAYHAVLRLLRLAVKETRKDTIQNKERFIEEFGPEGGRVVGWVGFQELMGR